MEVRFDVAEPHAIVFPGVEVQHVIAIGRVSDLDDGLARFANPIDRSDEMKI
jgi:hypothetical protein